MAKTEKSKPAAPKPNSVSKEKKPSADSSLFPVVGIGASADKAKWQNK